MSFQLVSAMAWNGTLYDLNYDIETTVKDIVDLYPKKATKSSAGYDFFMPFDLDLEPDKIYKIPTGFKWNPFDSYIKAKVDFPESDDKNKKNVASNNPFENTIFVPTVHLLIESPVLLLLPRSSLGFNYGFRLLNGTGVIDADYFNNKKNEGHIIVGCRVDKALSLKQGDKLCQGIIVPYVYNKHDEEIDTKREGGIGSTGK